MPRKKASPCSRSASCNSPVNQRGFGVVRQATHDAFFSMKAVKLSGIQIFGWDENYSSQNLTHEFIHF